MLPILSRHWPIAAILLLYVSVVSAMIPVAIDDIRMADVFSVDEANAAAEIRFYHATGQLDRASFKYGSLFYYVPLAAIHAYSVFGDISERVILTLLRSYGAIAGVGCLLLTYLLGRRLYGFYAGTIAALFLGASPTFLRWSVESHPDLPQLLCICGFMWTVIRLSDAPNLKLAVVSAIIAALAFNTKYVGLFLLPSLFFAVLFLGHGSTFRLTLEGTRIPERWKILLVSVAAFAVVFAVTNPYAIVKFDEFRRSLQSERSIMSFGHTFRQGGGPLVWGSLLIDILGWVNVAILTVGGVVFIKRCKAPSSAAMVLLFWCLTYLCYLVVFSSLVRPRHLLPVMPVLGILCGGGFVALFEELSSVSDQRLVAGVLTGLLVFSLYGPVRASLVLVSERTRARESQVEIVAGRWLAANFGSERTILYDSYSYIPSQFPHATRTFGMTYPEVEHFRPSLLVIRDAIAADYSNTSLATESRVGEVDFFHSHYFYKYLKEGKISEYRLAKQFDRTAIYEATDAVTPRDVAWFRLVTMFGEGKILGLGRAYERMAQIHVSTGNKKEASRQRQLRDESRLKAGDRYRKAVSLLREGLRGEATAIFDDMMSTVAARPDSYRAAVHQQIARSYFESSYFVEAADQAQEAMLTYDGLVEAHFELGVFLIAKGEATRADSVFQKAIDRFGPTRYPRSLLGQLVTYGIQPEAAQRAMDTYFPEARR